MQKSIFKSIYFNPDKIFICVSSRVWISLLQGVFPPYFTQNKLSASPKHTHPRERKKGTSFILLQFTVCEVNMKGPKIWCGRTLLNRPTQWSVSKTETMRDTKRETETLPHGKSSASLTSINIQSTWKINTSSCSEAELVFSLQTADCSD